MDFINEEDRVLVRLDLLHHLLQTLLKVAAVTRAGEQRTHVEGEDSRPGQNFGNLFLDDLASQTFGDRGLADAGIADEQRVVFLAAAQHLDRALHLGLAPDQRIDLAVTRLAVEVDAIRLERGLLLLAIGVTALIGPLVAFALLIGAARRFGIGETGALGDAVADVVHSVIARHILLLQEIGGMAFPFGEDRDEDVGPRDLLPAGRLHMDNGTLDHALEAGGRLGVLVTVRDEVLQVAFDVAP